MDRGVSDPKNGYFSMKMGFFHEKSRFSIKIDSTGPHGQGGWLGGCLWGWFGGFLGSGETPKMTKNPIKGEIDLIA
jgi:hypothetical protein